MIFPLVAARGKSVESVGGKSVPCCVGSVGKVLAYRTEFYVYLIALQI